MEHQVVVMAGEGKGTAIRGHRKKILAQDIPLRPGGWNTAYQMAVLEDLVPRM